MGRGMTRAERLREMERIYIQHPQGFTDIEMAERLGVDRTTAYRDRLELEREVPFKEVELGRWTIDRMRYLSAVRLNLVEALALYLAARRTSRHTRTHQAHIVSALEKLAVALRQPMTEQLVRAAEVVAQQNAESAQTAVLETVTRGWAEQLKVRITYRALSGRRALHYVVSPYLVEPSLWSDGAYLIGHSDVHGGLATFKIERIEQASLTLERFAIPDSFDEQELLRFAWGIWTSDEEPVTVRLRFSGHEAVRRLKESIWHPTQETTDLEDGGCVWTARVAEPQELLPWVRGWGADVEVLEPEGLREQLVQEIQRMAAVYQLGQLGSVAPPPLYQLLWAKTDEGKTRTHALIHHMLDVAQVALALWDLALPAATRRYFSAAMGMDEPSARRWLGFVCGLHDLGKACPVFQAQYAPGQRALAARGLSFEEGPVHLKTPHGWVSTHALRSLLSQRLGFEGTLARQIAYTVGGHHGAFPAALELQELGPARRGGPDWEAVRADLFEALAGVLSVRALPPWPEALADDQTFWTLLAGLVAFADWLGSIEKYFFDLSARYLGTYAERAYRQAGKALAQLGWSGWSPPVGMADFQTLFGFTPRPLQEAVISLAPRLAAPALVIVEAPTGEGKTEAAWYLADAWLQAGQQRGAYVAMPTQATSNQMLGRVQGFLERRYSGGQVSLLLLHGNAAWSDDMESLRLAAVDQETESTVVAHSWFLPKKRSLLAPFAVGTVDQALMSVLQTRHFFVRLFGLSHKTVIFDEVHAYDAYMSTLLQHLLRWLASMDTTVVLLSATLPEGTRRELVQAYTGRDFQQPVVYPSLSWATREENGVVRLKTSPLGSRSLALEWIDGQPDALVEVLRASLAQGGCAAVICNTVGRAQQVYRSLRAAQVVPDADLILFHARFPLQRRKEIEARVLQCFSKDGQRPQRAIVVATQVIEQSLDLDFDLMVTDLAPIDLLIQRAGRLHRHERKGRPTGLTVPHLLTMIPAMQGGVPRWGGDGRVYEPYVLLRSYLALRGRTQLCVPADVQPLIEAVYGDAVPLPGELDPPLQAALEQARRDMVRRMETDQLKARKNLIAAPDGGDVLGDGNRQLDEDNPELHQAWRALTRLIGPSVTLVCLHRQDDGVMLDSAGRQPAVLEEQPDRHAAAALIERSVSVSSYPLVQHFVTQEPPPGWRKHPMLRYCRAAIFVDGRCDLGTEWLILDPDQGLMVADKEGK